jgi:hypothetical protein
LPGVPGGFCGGEGGFASGFGAGRMGAGPVMTSKSKLLRCMEISFVLDQRPFQIQRISMQHAGNMKAAGRGGFGSCYGCTILGRREIPAVPKSRGRKRVCHANRYKTPVMPTQACIEKARD